MSILITGGAGFIGSNFIHYLLEKYEDIEIINLDKLTYAGNLDNLKDIEKEKRYNFVKGDIVDKKKVKDVFKKNDIEQIINFAAESHVDRSIKTPETFINTDVFGTFNLLETCRKYNIEKYVQISTDEVYGSILKGSFIENDTLNPSSPYSASKASADLIVNSYFKTYKLPVCITRSSNNFGPYQYPEKLIPFFIIKALKNQKLPLYGDGKNVRDWLYVKDNCMAIDLVRKKGKKGEIYNIGADNEKSNIEITNIIINELKKPKSFIKYVKDRPGHDKRYSINSEKIKKLGWKSKSANNFEKNMIYTIHWYLENKWWWENLNKLI